MSNSTHLLHKAWTWLRRALRNDKLVLSLLGIAIGAVGGGAVVAFRELIDLIQWLSFGSATERLSAYAKDLPWYVLVGVPTLGGLVVGIMVKFIMPQGRPEGVADAIEAAVVKGGRMSLRQGLGAALVNATSIGVGGSVGREGPAVHLGAALGGWIARKLHLTRSMSRTLLGCGVATAVAASFNAPIAGALFATEVVIGHYALSAFAPVVMASVVGTAISRAYFGDFPAFHLPPDSITSLWEFPAFIGLGIVSAIAAVLFMQAIFLAQRMKDRIPGPDVTKPAIGGFLVGLLALMYPEVLGVGYGATESALLGQYTFLVLVAIGLAKILATGVSLGFGFGGGVFSPSLVLGATVGGAFGIAATTVFPHLSSGPSAYTIVGMGAVASAVLGAPISTVLIIFEMTANYKLTMAVMVAVVVANVITEQMHGGSFFTKQLEQRGLDLRHGFERAVLKAVEIGELVTQSVMTAPPSEPLQDLREELQETDDGHVFIVGLDGHLLGWVTLADLHEMAFDHSYDGHIKAEDVMRADPPMIAVNANLEQAIRLMRDTGEHILAVVDNDKDHTFLGCVFERDVMARYNKALVEQRREEMG